MDSDVVIQARGLSKSYMIGHRGENGTTFREAIMRGLGSLARTTGDLLRGRPLIAGDELEEIWALRDVNFEVRRGEVLGIIGRNGAGKSTLLKVLSRITDPTEGRVEIRGRVASLLEVGTGFHPELTGRENIFLNGAILGMTRAEIRRKFDEIVDFAGVEKFLDTPVKRFSSGMYVRLAFAVAAHLEPEILIVDEVLAVGDAEFQKKCLGKMHDVAGEGRTVLFVSHNLAAVNTLCNRALVLSAGESRYDGATPEAIQWYLHETSAPTENKKIRLPELTVDIERRTLSAILKVDHEAFGPIGRLAIMIVNPFNVRVGLIDLAPMLRAAPSGRGESRFSLKLPPLIPGKYQIDFYVESIAFTGEIQDIRRFDILSSETIMPFDPQHMGVLLLRLIKFESL